MKRYIFVIVLLLFIITIASTLLNKQIENYFDINRKTGVTVEYVMSLLTRRTRTYTIITVKQNLSGILPLSYHLRNCNELDKKYEIKFSKIIFVFENNEESEITRCLNHFKNSTYMLGGLEQWMRRGLPVSDSENSKNFIGACTSNDTDELSEKTCL